MRLGLRRPNLFLFEKVDIKKIHVLKVKMIK